MVIKSVPTWTPMFAGLTCRREPMTDAPGVVYEVAAENLSAFAVTKESLLAAADTAETAEAAAQYPVE